MSRIGSSLGALALELTPGSEPARAVLDQEAGASLAALVARDLGRLSPRASELDLGLLAALFDPVELLRPGWPLHRELERLLAQAPEVGEPRVMSIAGRNGGLPQLLQPHAEFAGGALRLLPLALRGDPRIAAAVDAGFEDTLLDAGMAGADTALLAQQCFGASIEHARYLTLHDLAAMIAMQYDNVGLGAIWPLIETALLSPTREAWLDAPPEPLVRLIDGEAHIAMLDPESWAGSPLAPAGANERQLARGFEHFQSRQRQLASVLGAHGIPVTFDHCQAGRDARAQLLG